MDRNNKNQRITIRLSDEVFQSLKTVSEVQHISVGEIVRRIIANNPPVIIEGIETEEYKKTVADMARIGNLLKKSNSEVVRLIEIMLNHQIITKEEGLSEIRLFKPIVQELLNCIVDLRKETIKLKESIDGLSKK